MFGRNGKRKGFVDYSKGAEDKERMMESRRDFEKMVEDRIAKQNASLEEAERARQNQIVLETLQSKQLEVEDEIESAKVERQNLSREGFDSQLVDESVPDLSDGLNA
jgi:hypothetical protein